MFPWMQRIYAFFWRRTSGRPWTYEIRDWSHRHSRWAWLIVGFLIVSGVAAQFLSAQLFGLWAVPAIVWFDFMAYLGGHLYWDTSGEYVHTKSEEV